MAKLDGLPADWLTYHEEPVTLHSGWLSHWLVDAHVLFDCDPVREAVLDCWAKALVQFDFGSPRSVYGIPSGGREWAKAFAAHAGLELSMRPTPWMVIIDDVTTTGRSLYEYQGLRLVVVSRNPSVDVTAAWMTINLPTFL